ncbi:UGGT1 [Cordylochernes scorpioides]|uniref:UGGT1 n=1 Tax=Cordylochernes scorpioides TaxID=51811 RepID=A0ABY6KP53_9ARAC|nr:UGGT1 [Cordylochernes scorpioides]
MIPRLILLSLLLVGLLEAKKPVTISLSSRWLHTPLHLEASEFLAEESADLFWRYIQDMVQLGPGHLQSLNPREQYEAILQVAGPLLSPARLAFLKYSLSLRVYSPVIETFRQMGQGHLPEDCDTVAEVGGTFVCDISQLQELLAKEPSQAPAIYKMDHRYPSLASPTNTTIVILYGEIGTPSFCAFHKFLQEQVEHLEYYLRHYVHKPLAKKVPLSGYGVEMAIKSTEYKAQDDTVLREDAAYDQATVKQSDSDELEGFIFSQLKALHGDKSAQLEELKSYLLESTKEVATLKVWELQELSLQAAQKIVNSPREEGLRVLRDIAQNFPIRARSLVDIKVSHELKQEIEKNQQFWIQTHNIAPQDAGLFINGLYQDVETLDVFSLLQLLRQETRVLEGLHDIGVAEDKAGQLLKMDFSSNRETYGLDIRDSSIQYINDLEHDREYINWPNSLRDLLRPMFPGMLRNVRKNIYNMVVIADPSQKEVWDIFKLVESFHLHSAPLRMGIVFAVNPDPSVDGFTDPGLALLEAFNFIAQDKRPAKGLSLITDVYAACQNQPLTSKIVIKQFQSLYPKEDLEMIFGLDSDYDIGRRTGWDFIERSGLGQPPKILLNGILLKLKTFSADVLEDAILAEVVRQSHQINKWVYKGEVTDSDNVVDFLMSQSNIMPRLNHRVLDAMGPFADLSGHIEQLTVAELSHLPARDLGPTFTSHLHYLQRNTEDLFRPLTAWIVGDMETEAGQRLLLDALNHIKSSSLLRLAVIHNPSGSESLSDNPVSRAVQAAIDSLDPAQAKLYLHKLLKPAAAKLITSGEKSPVDLALSVSWKSSRFVFGCFFGQHTLPRPLHCLSDLYKVSCSISPDVCPDHGPGAVPAGPGQPPPGHPLPPLPVLPAGPPPAARSSVRGPQWQDSGLSGAAGAVWGGGLQPTGEVLHDSFWQRHEEGAGARSRHCPGGQFSLFEKCCPVCNEGKCGSEMVMKATALLLSQNQSPRPRMDLQYWDDQHSVITLPASDPQEPAHNLVAILDPVSRSAQKLAPILAVVHRVVNCNLRIFFNSIDKHSSMPLKSFFRFVMEEEPQFGEDGSQLEPVAHFATLPTSPLFTMAMATPENWMVGAVRSVYDLDNIHLEKVERGVRADFELEHLILEGNCQDQSTGNPPRGLQFTLGTNSTPVQVDTIVMANLGYFQLKANPGAWVLRLRQGRSAEIYDIVTTEGTDSLPGSPDVTVVLNSFRSHSLRIRVNKKPGMQYQDLLQDDSDEQGGIWNSLTSTFTTSNSGKEAEDPEEDKLNIFSLASGHLYERFLRIMMLSVLKNTKTPVKFWFLKNFLSPTFKEFLPHMAETYHFEYELVQYKWPRWLNQQTEKQRIIWGYKILFLDVLFPLSVKKIIFVDADQVVRADLRELRDLDLQGAPYGYTPFCDSRTDMEGYRFWKSGYWASHMGRRKYHISALYVVDLKRFRRVAAGDRLRGQYQGLSQDPNSLSNLDQDLPNNMIHQVAIHSLPQEWLWCETWCDDHSKPSAKTIDLCNNPKTKESKLKSAMRIIPEWNDYDQEIKRLFEKFESHKKSQPAPDISPDSARHSEL